MIAHTGDTICAVSTPKGKGAIAIVRVSGPDCFRFIGRIFPQKNVSTIEHASIVRGDIIHPDTHELIDDVLISKFISPNSFTGEDIIEINCHGGNYVVQEIMSLVLQQGARLAEPGEFTKRAFLNGKMDLLQAESVADIINAQTRISLKYAQQQLSGQLSDRLFELRDRLKKQLSLLEIELDFSEEDIEFVSRDEMMINTSTLIHHVNQLIRSFKFGKIIREGVHLALAGKPNVGKSSVMNRLLQEDRAIVSEIPGTTRDVIEESLDIDGLLFKMSDTAGIRLTEDSIESKGVERTKNTLARADQVVFIVDSSEDVDELDFEALKVIKSSGAANVLLLINKIDLNGNKIDPEFVNQFSAVCRISAITGEGFDDFKRELYTLNMPTDAFDSEIVFTKVRHWDALRRCNDSLKHAQESIKRGMAAEFIALDIRSALDALGEITGDVTTDDILNDIFSSFCIGK